MSQTASGILLVMEANKAREEHNLSLMREMARPLFFRLHTKLCKWVRHFSERQLRKSQRSTARRLRFERNRAR